MPPVLLSGLTARTTSMALSSRRSNERRWSACDEKLRKDMQDPVIARLIEQDRAGAGTLRVTRTPGFFVNGKPLLVFGYDRLQLLVEAELRANY